MKKMIGTLMLLAAFPALFPSILRSQTRQRSDIPIQDTWNLKDLYPSDEAWNEAKKKLASQFADILKFKGKLSSSASELLSCLEFTSRIAREFDRLNLYASQKSDEDIRISIYLSMKQEMDQLRTQYRALTSFIEPEILNIDKERLDGFLKDEPGLKVYQMSLFDLLRRKEHKLSEKEEKILAEAGLLANGPDSIYSMLSNAELPYPEIVLSDGNKVKLDQAGYNRYRALPERKDREAVFHAFWNSINNFRGTFGEALYAEIKKDIFFSKTRGYKSSLHAALDVNNIPVEVYLALIDSANKNLDSFHRYLNLKKRLLKVDQLKYSDVYAPVSKDAALNYSLDQAKTLILESAKPMGQEYQAIIAKAFENRWIDFYPTPGKASGAYSNSCYDVHPYMLLNYSGLYSDVSMLAHELGHSIHSYFANKTQPYPLAEYSIFVAEVASTFNEALLIHKVLDGLRDDQTRLALSMNYLDGLKGTLFRQSQFAEFELRIHEKAERGEPLTGEILSQIYGEILKKYYGHDQGVCLCDDLYSVEWAFIPHFYYNFYVYQYATSFTASTALAEKVLNNEPGAIERYLEFLSSGGSDYPIPLLKKAGVDMTTAEPFEKAISAMNRAMDEIEKILDQKN